MGDPTSPKHQLRSCLPPALTQQPQHSLTQQFQHVHGHQHQINTDWITSAVSSTSPANPVDFDPDRELVGGGRGASLDPSQPFLRAAAQSPSPQRSLTPDLQLPVVTDASILNLTSLSRYGTQSRLFHLTLRNSTVSYLQNVLIHEQRLIIFSSCKRSLYVIL